MKKIFFSFALLLALFTLNFDAPEKTLVQTESSSQIYTIHSRSLTAAALVAPYSAFDSFVSEELSAEFDFTTVGLSWQQTVPEGARIESYIRFQQGKTWSDWLDLEEEEDLKDPEKYYATASGNPSQKFQYRFDLYAGDKGSPLIQNVEWTFIKSGEITAEAKPQIKTAANIQSQIISRADWGANENLRYLDDGEEQILVERDPEFYEKYKDELQYSHVIDQDQNTGQRYVWPLQYPESVEKIVVHHSATTKDLDNPAQAIRDIYQYHASTRGWGDIGYNYIIDQQGQIYEGRAGGEGVIAAHAGPGNHGSIGIALLGNYQDNPVPEVTLTSLSELIYQKSKIHGFTPDGSSDFRGENRPNVFGHRDIMSTTCPGQYLYEKIPFIRTLAANAFKEKPKFVTDYDYQDKSELYYTQLQPNQIKKYTLTLENIGNKAWDKNTVLKLKSDPEFESTLNFPTASNLILSTLNETSVEPGKRGTFDFTLGAGQIGKTVYLQITPSFNSQTDATDHISIAVSVTPPIYSYKILEADYPPATMKSGDKFEGQIKIQNTGNTTWQNLTFAGQPGTYTLNPQEITNFNYTYTAPKNAGEFHETLALSLPNAKFSNSESISFKTLVYRGDYDSVLYSKSPVLDLEKANDHTLSVTLKNTGLKTWEESDLTATFLKEPGLNILDLEMSPNSVKTGETAKITFTVEIAENASASGIFLARFKNAAYHISRPISFNYTLTDPKFQTPEDKANQIRIKLSSLNVEPIITADGSFAVYNGDQMLKNLSAGDELKVTLQAGKFAILAGDTAFLENGPIRVIPKSAAILQIKNFEHRPAWDQTLNDNKYRGTLEIRIEDGKLIVINELHLEDYLKGLGEVSNSELPEKIKAIIVAARSYAKFYTTKAEKFPGKPYHLDDNPEVSQKYLGYGLELRSPNVTAGVDATKGQVVGLNGQVVKAPYFNQSDGVATKSAKEVWGWTDTPYLISVPDTHCEADKFLGHGVGLSGCGAKAFAQQGKTYEEILKYYYTGIEILDLY